jgi:hypothetical protein
MYLSAIKNAVKSKKQLQGQALQRQSYVNNKGQTYDYDIGTVTVGKKMEAWLDYNSIPHGQSANLNKGQDEMMSAIRSCWGIVGGDVVKGHLLNDNLGGTANNNNLYPITRGANKNHLNYVENGAKKAFWVDKSPGIYYKVTVDADPDIESSTADFDCEIRYWNPSNNQLGPQVISPTTIPSDLEDVRSKDSDSSPFETYTGDDVDMISRPKKPKWALKPKTKVSELTFSEKQMRDDDMEF